MEVCNRADRGWRVDWITASIDAAVRETMLFAAAGLLIGGLDDLIVDLCFLARRGMGRGAIPAHLDRLPAPTDSGCLAIFVAACGWSGNREGGRGGIQWDRVGSIGLDIAENGGWAVHARAFRGCWPIRRRRSQFGWRGRGDRWADEAHFPIPGSAAFPVCRSARFARGLQASYIGDATRVTR